MEPTPDSLAQASQHARSVAMSEAARLELAVLREQLGLTAQPNDEAGTKPTSILKQEVSKNVP